MQGMVRPSSNNLTGLCQNNTKQFLPRRQCPFRQSVDDLTSWALSLWINWNLNRSVMPENGEQASPAVLIAYMDPT